MSFGGRGCVKLTRPVGLLFHAWTGECMAGFDKLPAYGRKAGRPGGGSSSPGIPAVGPHQMELLAGVSDILRR